MTMAKKRKRKKASAPAEQAERARPRGRPIEAGEHLSPATEWKPGQSGNPKGRPSAGLAVIEFVNLLKDMTQEQIKAIAMNPGVEVYKRIAAREWLKLLSDEVPPEEARHALRMMLDYTHGRPKQSADLTLHGSLTVATGQLTKEMLERLDADEEDA